MVKSNNKKKNRNNSKKMYGDENIDIKKIYDKLIANGFYENISLKICDKI